MKRPRSSTCRELLRYAQELGWTSAGMNKVGHLKVQHASGAKLVLPSRLDGGGRLRANMMALLRKNAPNMTS